MDIVATIGATVGMFCLLVKATEQRIQRNRHNAACAIALGR